MPFDLGIENIYLRIFANRRFYRWNLKLYDLCAKCLGLLNFDSICDSGETEYLKRLCKGKKNFTLVDVGARFGSYSNFVKRSCPNAQIFAFEPHPFPFGILLKKAESKGYKAFQLALGERSEIKPLYDRAIAKGSSCHASFHPENIESVLGEKLTSIDVPTRTLDEMIEELGISSVDLLKIDVEGHELAVLKGAQNSIRLKKIKQVQFEFEEVNSLLGIFVRDFENCLKDFDFFRIAKNGDLLPISHLNIRHKEIFAYQNILAIQRRE